LRTIVLLWLAAYGFRQQQADLHLFDHSPVIPYHGTIACFDRKEMAVARAGKDRISSREKLERRKRKSSSGRAFPDERAILRASELHIGKRPSNEISAIGGKSEINLGFYSSAGPGGNPPKNGSCSGVNKEKFSPSGCQRQSLAIW
jgi:hypothetical protein